MDEARIRSLLQEVAAGNVAPDQALDRLRDLPFEDLEFVKVDHHRALRTGLPETIYCQGKTPEQVVEIARHIQAAGANVLGTRCEPDVIAAVRDAFPEMLHHEAARCFTLVTQALTPYPGYVAVVSAGTSDIPVAEEAAVTCEIYGTRVERVYDVGVAGIHRLFGRKHLLDAAQVIIVVAGMEGALASVVGGLVEQPVISVPTSIGYGAHLNGLAPLLTMLNSCASGVSVVNIDNGFGAAVCATTIMRAIHAAAKPGESE